LSLFTKYKLKNKTNRNNEIFKEFGYLLGAISTGYISDRKIGEIFAVVPF
jgi:hypothetical protein